MTTNRILGMSRCLSRLRVIIGTGFSAGPPVTNDWLSLELFPMLVVSAASRASWWSESWQDEEIRGNAGLIIRRDRNCPSVKYLRNYAMYIGDVIQVSFLAETFIILFCFVMNTQHNFPSFLIYANRNENRDATWRDHCPIGGAMFCRFMLRITLKFLGKIDITTRVNPPRDYLSILSVLPTYAFWWLKYKYL